MARPFPNQPVVSVVIPTYRGGRFLREAVASVQAQTLDDWEIVIVADGCGDDLSDIAAGDARIRVLRQRQRGVSIARNVGIAHARADLIAFLDDDDRMLPGRLLAQCQALGDDSIGLCHTQHQVIDSNGEPRRPGGSKGTLYRDFLRGDGGVVLSSVMARKSVLQELGGFNSLLPLGEDLDLVYRVAAETGISFLPQVLTEYRRHGDNTWSETTTTKEIRLILSQHLLVAEARQHRDDVKAVRTGMANLQSGRAAFAMYRGREAQLRRDYLGVVVALGQALVYSPRGSFRAIRRSARRDVLGDRSIAAAVGASLTARRRAQSAANSSG